MNGDRASRPSFKKLDVMREQEHPELAMNPDTALVTKAPVDLLKTCVIFVFPALGGLLFGRYSCALHTRQLPVEDSAR